MSLTSKNSFENLTRKEDWSFKLLLRRTFLEYLVKIVCKLCAEFFFFLTLRNNCFNLDEIWQEIWKAEEFPQISSCTCVYFTVEYRTKLLIYFASIIIVIIVVTCIPKCSVISILPWGKFQAAYKIGNVKLDKVSWNSWNR